MEANFRWTRTPTLCRKCRFLLRPLFIVEPKPLPFELQEHDSLFNEIVGDHLLMAVKPAGQVHYEEMERLYCVRHSTYRLSLILFDNNIIWAYAYAVRFLTQREPGNLMFSPTARSAIPRGTS